MKHFNKSTKLNFELKPSGKKYVIFLRLNLANVILAYDIRLVTEIKKWKSNYIFTCMDLSKDFKNKYTQRAKDNSQVYKRQLNTIEKMTHDDNKRISKSIKQCNSKKGENIAHAIK